MGGAPQGTRTYRTAVVLLPPPERWGPIQAIRAQHDRHYRRWMPHITLIYPFHPREAWQADLAPLTRACAGIAPFEVALPAFGTFDHGRSHTLWLAPTPVAPLIALQEALWRAVPDCADTRRHGGGYTPHLSVGQAGGAGAAAALLAALEATWTPLRFTAHAVHLIWRGDPPDDVFRIGREIALGAAKPASW
ncbi:MAG: 2'-5' RNA ligase family protein [Anaerolineae bacterium]|nr:2'-5' RNA ligase family protein [Anaerolineae bacterium]